MKKPSAEDKGPGERGALTQDDIEQAVARYAEAYRVLLLLVVRLVRESGETR